MYSATINHYTQLQLVSFSSDIFSIVLNFPCVQYKLLLKLFELRDNN